MKYFISIMFFLIASNAAASSMGGRQIVAFVNDMPITKHDLDARVKMAETLNKIDVSDSEVRKKLNRDVLNILVEEELLNQYAAKSGIKISQEDIDNAIAGIEDRNNMAKGHLKQYFQEIGVDLRSFNNQIKGELIKYHIITSLSNSVSVTPRELDLAIINSGHEGFDVEAWLFTSLEEGDKALQKMGILKKKLVSCKNMDQRLYKNIADAEKINGNLDRLDPKLKSVILDTRVGRASSIYKDEGKFKMVFVCSRTSSISSDDANKVRSFLSTQTMNRKAIKFFSDLKRKAIIKIFNDFSE